MLKHPLIKTTFLLLSTLLLTATIAQADELSDNLQKLEDLRANPERQFDGINIKSWKSLDYRWAGALDAQGNMIAIYDLSFPELFMGRAELGNLGGKKITKKMISAAILNAKKNPQTDLDQADEALDTLNQSQKGPIEDGSMPDQWWTRVPWKNNKSNATAPDSFRLSEIDFTKIKNVKIFQKALKISEKALSEIEGPEFNSDLLSQFEFVKVADGSYSFYWDNPARSPKVVSMPRKLADLTNPKWAFHQAMEIELIDTILSEASSFIPVPIVAGLVATAMDRFFHFYDLLNHTNQNMILEMLNSVQDGNEIFSTTPLTAAETTNAVESLVFSQTSLFTSFEWIWTNPLSDWKKSLSQQASFEIQSTKWLANHGLTPVLLSPRFAYNGSAKLDTKALLILARQKPDKKTGPSVAINYGDLTRIQKDRETLELSTSAVVFGTNFLPFFGAGTIVKDVYKHYVESPTDISKTWEGRLTAHLEEREIDLHESYSDEIAVLDNQRVNPFFGKRSAMIDLIHQRKVLLGLP